MSTPLLDITVDVRQGQLDPSEPLRQLMTQVLSHRDGKQVRVVITKPERGRSNAQNRYMWGLVYAMIAENTGHTAEEVHEACKAMFLPRQFVEIGGREVEIPKSTTSLSTVEMETYLERVRVFAASNLGITIPLPNEGDSGATLRMSREVVK